MSALSFSFSDSKFCGAGAEGKTGEDLLDHFREFVRKVWESESPPGLFLVLRPELVQTATGWVAESKESVPESSEKAVYFLNAEQIKCLQPESYEIWRTLGRFHETGAVLMKTTDGCQKYTEVEMGTTKAKLIKWFAERRMVVECVVCYEQTGPGGMCSISCAMCGANVCVQCDIEIALDAKRVGHFRVPRCPLCATKLTVFFPETCRGVVVDKTLSEAHREFVSFWNAFDSGDYSRALRCDFQKMTAKMRNVIEIDFAAILHRAKMEIETELRESRTKKERCVCRQKLDKARFNLDKYIPLLRNALRKCDAAKVKRPLKSASDDSIASGSAVPNRVRSDRCARCQKVFWDKKEKKRAPKCPKCKRVAYCSGVCRKKHRATHKLQCEAGAKAKSKKKAAAKAAKLYGR